MSALNVIAHDKQLIPYRKELNAITGGVTSTILLQQFVYWWKKAGNKPFFKFIEPCGHDYYKDGDSWTEELGFTVREFKTAYRRLEDAGLVSKKIGADRVTWYTLHTEALEQQVEGLYVNAERAVVTAERAVPVTAERAIHTTNSRLPVDYNSIPPNPQGEGVDTPIKPSPTPKKRTPAFGLNDLLSNNPHGIAEQVLSDWLQSRKASRAAVSETVWLGILRELAKCADAGISPESALIEAVMAGWRGFKFEWIQNRLSANNTRHAATNSYDCPKCGSHMDDCVCWAETINEGPF